MHCDQNKTRINTLDHNLQVLFFVVFFQDDEPFRKHTTGQYQFLQLQSLLTP